MKSKKEAELTKKAIQPYTTMIEDKFNESYTSIGQKQIPASSIEIKSKSFGVKTIVSGNYETSELAGSDLQDVYLQTLHLYKLRFYGIGLKDIPLNFYHDKTTGINYFAYGKAHLVGTYIDIYFLPLSNPFPFVAVAGVLTGIAAVLGITLLVLKKIDDMSLVLLPIAAVPILIIYRKPIMKALK